MVTKWGCVRIFTCVLLSFISFVAYARDEVPKARLLSERQEYFPTVDCAAHDTCDLVGVGFHEVQYSLDTVKSDSTEVEYGTSLYAWYDTKDHTTLEKYVFVQYLRGCHFETNVYRGVTTRHFGETYHHGAFVPKCFPDWVVDRDNEDPVYFSELGKSRHHNARWSAINAETFSSTRTMNYYWEGVPPTPRLGMFDWPSGALVRKWENGRIHAQNVLLEFRTCLYRTKDVPPTFDETKDKLPPAIVCFEWKSTFVYDQETDAIKTGNISQEICRDPAIAASVEVLINSQKKVNKNK